MMDIVLNILTFLALLLVLIGFHEFAHLIVGKWCKIPVEKFSIGYGPALVKWKWGETEYQLSLLPLGGYVKFVGEDFDDPEGFFSYPFGRKTAATSAGIIANLILALVIYFIIGLGWGVESPPAVVEFSDAPHLAEAGLVNGDTVIAVEGNQIRDFYGLLRFLPNDEALSITVGRADGRHELSLPPTDVDELELGIAPVIGQVLPKSPAHEAGIQSGDRVIAVDGEALESWSQLVTRVGAADTAHSLQITWIHGVDTVSKAITPKKIAASGTVGLGVLVHVPSRPLTFGEVFWLPVARTGQTTWRILSLVGKMFVGKESVRNLAGPVGIYQLTAQSRELGFASVLGLLALLSISLAIINILPIPMFDGGRIIMFIIEKIIGKSLGKKAWTVATYVGLAMIGALVILVFYNDISRIITGG